MKNLKSFLSRRWNRNDKMGIHYIDVRYVLYRSRNGGFQYSSRFRQWLEAGQITTENHTWFAYYKHHRAEKTVALCSF